VFQNITELLPRYSRNNRSEISASTFFFDEWDETSGDPLVYAHATNYSGAWPGRRPGHIHGNVKELVQDHPILGSDGWSSPSSLKMNHRFKKIGYEYDLISGNVKRVSYQKGKKDQWSHRYRYDADNRITEVETSADGVHWQRDARYFYYPHGPLERTELGAHVVQGTDYAYTLQGWLKGINGDRLDPATDMGKDGAAGVNSLVGRDAFAMSLGYYGDADYKGIGTAWNDDQPASIAQRPFAPIGTAATANTISEEHRPLYNGNIAHTVNTLQPFGLWGPTGEGQVLAQVYHYDQLNRLRAARAYTGLDENNTWDGVADAVANRYRSAYEYDANGNITGAARFDGSGNWYDWFAYKYQKNNARLMRNRLYQLNDLADQANAYVNEAGGAQDIGWTGDVPFDEEDPDMNTAYNYGYDALGNLVRDDREHIEAIEWTVAGKVKAVDHATGEGPDLAFGYGASGQRIMKQVGQPGTDAGAYREHYIRDAQGNIMATYRYTNETSVGVSLLLNERPIYGSSRLGSYTKTMQLYNAQAITSYPPPSSIIQRPHLRYELTDHLGNVAAVITGRLLPSQSLAPFEADLVSAQGYEPFGSLMPGRNYSAGSYRFGFNGKEKDDEVHNATGTSYDFGARLYDPRTGRWLAIDPEHARYAGISPYAFVANSPLILVDPDGERIVVAGSAEYVASVTQVLGNLARTREGRRLIRVLAGSTRDILITQSASNGTNRGSDPNVISIDFNPADVSPGKDFGGKGVSITRVPSVSLAHEMRHAEQLDFGVGNGSGDVLQDSGSDELYDGVIPFNEVDAVSSENKVREELGLPRRTHYESDGKLFKVDGKKESTGYTDRSKEDPYMGKRKYLVDGEYDQPSGSDPLNTRSYRAKVEATSPGNLRMTLDTHERK